MSHIFISYSSKDFEAVDAIRMTLEENGIPCWMAPRDIPVSSNYMEQIPLAIEGCSAFLVMISNNSQMSSWVLKELSTAFENHKQIIPFVIEKCELTKAFKFCFTDVQRYEIFRESSDNLRELIRTVRSVCGLPDDMPVNNVTVRSRLKSMYVPSRNMNFIGREDELAGIERLLEQERILFVYGLGGVGKTEIVREYISRHKNDFNTVIMAHYEGSLTDLIINDKYFSMEGIEREPMESDRDFCLRKLNAVWRISTEENTLIVIDNFDTDDDELLDEFISGPYKILVTTRINFEDRGFPTLRLGSMSRDEQYKFFSKNYKRAINEQDKVFLDEILSAVGGHTLAVELIAKLMNTKRMSFRDMAAMLSSKGITPELSGNVKSISKRSGTIYSHIESLFEFESLSDDEISIMKELSLLPIAGAGFDEFMEWCELDDAEVINGLIERSWVRYDEENETISLHPVISDISRSRITDPYKECMTMIRAIWRRLAESWYMTFEERNRYGEYAMSLYHKLGLAEGEYMFLSFFSYYVIFKNLDKEKELIEITSKELGEEDSVERGWMKYCIGDLYNKYQRFDKSIEYLKESVEIMNRAFPVSYDQAYLTKHIAHICHAAFRREPENTRFVEMAYDYLNESERIFNLCLEGDYREMCSDIYLLRWKDYELENQKASRCYAFALNFYYKGQYEAALSYGTRSFEMFKELYGEVNTDTNAPMRVLAMTYSKLKRFDEAVDMEMRVIDARKQLWGEYDFRYFEQFETLADIYIENGEVEKGLDSLRNAIDLAKSNESIFGIFIKNMQNKIRAIEEG